MPIQITRFLLTLVAAFAAALAWYFGAAMLADGVLDLLIFAGPGALFGVGTGWLAHLFDQRQFTWRVGLWSALLGGIVLPPLLAALVAVGGLAVPGVILFLFVVGAWGALGLGLVVALVRRFGGAASSVEIQDRLS